MNFSLTILLRVQAYKLQKLSLTLSLRVPAFILTNVSLTLPVRVPAFDVRLTTRYDFKALCGANVDIDNKLFIPAKTGI